MKYLNSIDRRKLSYLRNAASPPGNGNSPSRKGTVVIGDTGWPAVPFVASATPWADKSPFAIPDDATAAIKDGKEYPAPTDVATEGCPKREAAAAAIAAGCDAPCEVTSGKMPFRKGVLDILFRFKIL